MTGKPKDKPFIRTVALAAAVVIVLAWFFFGRGPALFCRESQDGWRFHTGQLLEDMSVGQTFISRLDNLTRVDLMLGTYGLPAVKGTALHLVEVEEHLPQPRSEPMPAGDGGTPLEIADGSWLGQTFIPRRDGLSGIWLLIDRRSMTDEAAIRLKVREQDAGDCVGPLLGQATVTAVELPHRGFYCFRFPPVPDSAGRRLCFTVEVTGAPPGAGLRLRLAAFKTLREEPIEETPYPDGRALGRDDLAAGDLIFRPAYQPVLPEGPVIRRATRSGWRLADNRFNAFVFEPIPESKGKKYYAYLTAEPGTGVGPTALADTVGRYPYGSLVLDHVPARGGLAFRTYHAIPRSQAARLFIEGTTRRKPEPWRQPWLLISLGAAHLLLAGAVVTGVALAGRKEGRINSRTAS